MNDKVMCDHCFGYKCLFEEINIDGFACASCKEEECGQKPSDSNTISRKKVIGWHCIFLCPKCKGTGIIDWIDSLFPVDCSKLRPENQHKAFEYQRNLIEIKKSMM